MLKVLSCYVVTVLLCVFPVYGEDSHIKETHKEESKRHGNVSSKLFKAEQWDKLEKLLGETRKLKKRNSFGGSLLFDYYSGCSVDYEHKWKMPEAQWLKYKKKLARWEKAKPNSISVVCLKIGFWTTYAWKERGGDYEVKGKDWERFFDEGLDEAEKIYAKTREQYGDKLIPCPQFYRVAMKLALGKGWSNQKAYNELLKPVIKNWPLSHRIYKSYSRRLKTIWYGDGKTDSYDFYNSLKEDIGGELGKEISAYGIFLTHGRSLNAFRYDLVDQDEMLEGLLYHVRRNPNDVDLLRRIITFSTRYDFETTHKLLKDLRELAPTTFKQFEEKIDYGIVIKAMMESPEKSIELDYYIRPESHHFIISINDVATQDGVDHFVCSLGWNGLEVLRNQDCKLLARTKKKSGDSIFFSHVELSKSGKYIFVEVVENEKRVFRVYSFKDKKLELVRTEPSTLGFMESARFVEEDETILIAGEEKGSRFKKSLYFRWKWKTEKPKLVARSARTHKTKMAVLEDEKRVVCSAGESLLYYNYMEEKPEIHKVEITVGGVKPTLYDIHYAKEIDALAVLTTKDNYLAVLDAKTFEVKSSRKLNGYPSLVYLLDGYKHGDCDYTFCVSGDVGQISILHYNNTEKEPISYESTWVNAHYYSGHLSVVEKEGESPRIIQSYNGVSLLGSYIQKKKEAD